MTASSILLTSFFCIFVCVSDSVLSRSLSKPSPCRQQGPPQSQVRATKVSLSPFCHVNSQSCHPPLAVRGVVFNFVSALGFTANPNIIRSKRKVRRKICPGFLCFYNGFLLLWDDVVKRTIVKSKRCYSWGVESWRRG